MALCVNCLDDVDYGFMPLGNGVSIICYQCLEQLYKDSKLWMGNTSHPWYRELMGPVTSSNDRGSFRYKEWRIRVLQRDNDQCQECGSKENLAAHHIEDFANNPDKRFDVSNGVTLCSNCHKNKHRLR